MTSNDTSPEEPRNLLNSYNLGTRGDNYWNDLQWWGFHLSIIELMSPGRPYTFREIYDGLANRDLALLPTPCERTVYRHLFWFLNYGFITSTGHKLHGGSLYQITRANRRKLLDILTPIYEATEALHLFMKQQKYKHHRDPK